MSRGRARALLLLLGLSTLSFSGCFVRRRIITRKGAQTTPVLLTADKQSLIDRIARQYQTVQSLNATLDMVPALGSSEKSKITEYKEVRGYILFRKPAEIRIVGLYPVVRNKAFDMVSDGKDFRLYLPGENRFIIGSNELSAPSKNKIENLRPQHFLEALLVPPVAADEKPELMNYTDEDNAAYVLHLVHLRPDGTLVPSRSIWFNRVNLHMARQIVFDAAGNILTDARYDAWQNYDNVPFPKTVDIERPQDEYGVVMTVVKLEINRGVTDNKFVLEQPEGTLLQVLGQTPPPAPAAPAPAKQKKKKKP